MWIEYGFILSIIWKGDCYVLYLFKKFSCWRVATIISTKYKNARLALPTLSDKYENIEMHIKKIGEYVDNNNFVVAIDSGKVIGFINGFSINEFKGTSKGVLSLPSLHGIADGYDKKGRYNRPYWYGTPF